MKKTNYLLLLALCLCMSSCVYSLFPIYTKESLVYLKDLEGTWENGEGGLIKFGALGGNLSITVTPGDDEFIVVEGDTIRDKEQVAAYWEKEMEKELTPKLQDLSKTGYLLEIIENGDTLNFQGKLAQIGENYFLDLYPADSFDDDNISRNFFPVHTFMKLDVQKDQLTLTQFDLDKLTDLFDSNRIRLRHEKVNETIVITAQSEEIQKFLRSYSQDETVFDTPDNYKRVGP